MNFSKLDTFFNDMPKRGYPFCEIAVSKDGETVFRKSVGFSDSEKTRPSSSDDIYWIYSATKVVTCTAAMRLVEQGVISLDDPVSKYLPEYADMTVKARDGSLSMAKNTMTVEHLFTMTGGMNYSLVNPSTIALINKGATTIELVRAMAREPLSFEPGTHYQYSLCHDVLAAVVEIASGMRFSDYLQSQLFDPLAMKDIGFRPSEEQKKRMCAMYTYLSGTATHKEVTNDNRFILTDNYDSGGAGLFATVDDYMKLITVLACGGTSKDGYHVLSPESIRMMGENRLCYDALNDFAKTRLYGYGWGLCGRAHMDPTISLSLSPVGEFGWDGAANAFVMVDPVNHVAAYFGTQIRGCTYGYNVIHPTLRNLIYEGLEE